MLTRQVVMASFIYLNFRRISDFSASRLQTIIPEIDDKPSLYQPGDDYPSSRTRYEVFSKKAFRFLVSSYPPCDLIDMLERGMNVSNRFVFIQDSFYAHGLKDASIRLQEKKPIKSVPYLHTHWKQKKIEVPVSPEDFFGRSYVSHFRRRPLVDVIGVVTSDSEDIIVIAPVSISFSVVQHELTQVFQDTIVIPVQSPYTGAKEIEKIFRQAQKSIKLVDAYTDEFTLDRLNVAAHEISIQLITAIPKKYGNKDLARFDRFKRDIKLFRQEHPQFECRAYSPLHVRLIAVDDTPWLLDPSVKDAGRAWSVIQKISERQRVLDAFDRMWEDGSEID